MIFRACHALLSNPEFIADHPFLDSALQCDIGAVTAAQEDTCLCRQIRRSPDQDNSSHFISSRTYYQTTIDPEHCTGNKTGFIRSEEQVGIGDFFGFPDPT